MSATERLAHPRIIDTSPAPATRGPPPRPRYLENRTLLL